MHAVLAVVALSLGADYIDHFADPSDIGLMKIPRDGATTVLVLPIAIADQPFEGGSEAAWLDILHRFYDPAAGGFSFSEFWSTQSLGRWTPTAHVAAPVHFDSCPPLGQFQDCQIPRGAGLTTGDIGGAVQTIKDAVDFIDAAIRCATAGPDGTACTEGGGLDIAAFDQHGLLRDQPDGFIDGMILVSNARFPGIALPIKHLSSSPLLQFVGPFPELVYDGVTVNAVAISGGTVAVNTSVHEVGHLLGFADLYNETQTTTDMPFSVMGGWSYTNAAPLLDPYSRMAAGWAHVVQVSGPGTFTLAPTHLSGTVLKIGTGDEFFVAELREQQPGVFDDDMPASAGVVIERVRMEEQPSPERGQYLDTLSNCVNCTPFDSFLSIEQADGAFGLEFSRAVEDEDLFLPGDEIAPSDDTAPRSLDHPVFSTNLTDGTPTGITIRVTSIADGVATLEVDAPAVADGCAEIERWCADLPCDNGECGRVLFPPPPEDPGCACDSRRVAPAAAVWAVLPALWWARRRRR